MFGSGNTLSSFIKYVTFYESERPHFSVSCRPERVVGGEEAFRDRGQPRYSTVFDPAVYFWSFAGKTPIFPNSMLACVFLVTLSFLWIAYCSFRAGMVIAWRPPVVFSAVHTHPCPSPRTLLLLHTLEENLFRIHNSDPFDSEASRRVPKQTKKAVSRSWAKQRPGEALPAISSVEDKHFG
jgi:hypothetical protein